MWSSLSNSFVQKDGASSSSSSQKGKRRGQAATSSPYLSLILAADFTAGMRRWDQPLSVLNEHGVVTVLKTTQPRNRGLGCTSRYVEASTKTALLAAYLTVKHTWQPVCHETRKLFGCRMFAAAFRYPLSLLSQNTALMNPVCRALPPSCRLNLQLSVQTSVSPSAYERKTEVANMFSWYFLNLLDTSNPLFLPGSEKFPTSFPSYPWRQEPNTPHSECFYLKQSCGF